MLPTVGECPEDCDGAHTGRVSREQTAERGIPVMQTVMFCLFVNALYEWKGTKRNSCVRLNVTGE